MPKFDELMTGEFDLKTDYAIAKALRVRHSTIRRLRTGEVKAGERVIAQTLHYANRKRRAAGNRRPVTFEQLFEVVLDEPAS